MTTPRMRVADIDVIIATKNSEKYLEQCVRSVVHQELSPSRVVVIDQSSSDSTLEIISQFDSVEIQQQVGRGIPNAWNQGITSGASEFVALIDSDDYWTPSFLQDCFTALLENPTAQYAVAHAKFILDQDRLPRGFRPELVNAEKIGWMPGTTLFRRSLFSDVGLFPEDFVIASDIEWYARLRNLSVPMIEVPRIGLYKRMHGDNSSLDSEIAQVYRKEILRVARNSVKADRSTTS